MPTTGKWRGYIGDAQDSVLAKMHLTDLFFRPLPYYTLLSSSTDHQQNTKHKRRLIGAAAFVVALVTAVTWAAIVFFRKPPFSPLDHYQNINDLPIVHNGYRPTLSSPSKRAIVSSLYSDSYSIAVSVLAHSIRRANMTTPLLLPYLEGRVSSQALCITRAAGWTPIPIPYIAPPDNGAGVHERFKDQFTKLNIWGLDAHGIDRAVYLDADTLVRRSFDELFELPFEFAAVPDVYNGNRGFTIAFNAGVLAIRPSTPVLRTMMREIATAEYPRHEAEQSFLNLFFGAKALRLPYVYNANLAIKDRSPVLWDSMKGEMRIVHYTLVKPFTDDMMYAGPIRTIEEQRRVLDKTAKQFGGLFADEVGWWRQAFEDMIEDVGDAIQNCYPR